MNNCKAYQQKDGTFRCERCNLLWGKNDTPGKCETDRQHALRRLAEIRLELGLARFEPR